MHHSFPNLKGRDYVWAPLSKSEYDSLRPWRKTVERFYRSIFGLGAYYLVELWWNKLLFPSKRHVGTRRTSHLWDSWIVTFYLIAMILLCASFGGASAGNIALNLTAGILIPFCVWNYLMGFVIFVHHTHPTIAWYENKAAWAQGLPQITNTVHLTFPTPFSKMLHNIMEHNAHHADVNVPLYELPSAQASLEEVFGSEIVIEGWSVRGFLNCLQICKLFDFDKFCWLDFDGNTTATTTAGKRSNESEIDSKDLEPAIGDLKAGSRPLR
jgi:omega-6 fatty acid desaturase (delta-12 desaturase)